jgi:uncharacterized membrane protein YGL010W
MSPLVTHLSKYAAYHRDQRNVATHMVGIPLIVLAVAILLSRAQWTVGLLTITPAVVIWVATTLFYVRLDVAFGAAMAVFYGLAVWVGFVTAAQPTAIWLTAGLGAFAVGWLIQFIGHAYEGRKPAFLDDLASLAIGPLFIVAEAAFAVGLRRETYHEIENAVSAA